jgi:L-amino acid N-acyltransferase YncA
MLRDAQNQAVPGMATKILHFGVVNEKMDWCNWPMTLQNIDQLSGGRYTLEIPIQVYGETVPVQYTFVRPGGGN